MFDGSSAFALVSVFFTGSRCVHGVVACIIQPLLEGVGASETDFDKSEKIRRDITSYIGVPLLPPLLSEILVFPSATTFPGAEIESPSLLLPRSLAISPLQAGVCAGVPARVKMISSALEQDVPRSLGE